MFVVSAIWARCLHWNPLELYLLLFHGISPTLAATWSCPCRTPWVDRMRKSHFIFFRFSWRLVKKVDWGVNPSRETGNTHVAVGTERWSYEIVNKKLSCSVIDFSLAAVFLSGSAGKFHKSSKNITSRDDAYRSRIAPVNRTMDDLRPCFQQGGSPSDFDR